MKLNNYSTMFLSICFLLSTTTYTRYMSLPLKKSVSHSFLDQESISFQYKAFTKKDCKKYLNSTSILKKGYQPVQISITNNTKESLSFNLEKCNLPLINAQEIANTLHRDGVMRGLGFWVGSWFFFPLIIPAFVQGFGAKYYNQDMNIDFELKALRNQEILPYTTIEGLVFIDKDKSYNNITFSLQQLSNKKNVIISAQQPHVVLS